MRFHGGLRSRAHAGACRLLAMAVLLPGGRCRLLSTCTARPKGDDRVPLVFVLSVFGSACAMEAAEIRQARPHQRPPHSTCCLSWLTNQASLARVTDRSRPTLRVNGGKRVNGGMEVSGRKRKKKNELCIRAVSVSAREPWHRQPYRRRESRQCCRR